MWCKRETPNRHAGPLDGSLIHTPNKKKTKITQYILYTHLKYTIKYIKGGCAHFDMCILHSKLIDLDPRDTFCTILPQGFFLFSLPGQKQVCDTGDEAVMKIAHSRESGPFFDFRKKISFFIGPHTKVFKSSVCYLVVEKNFQNKNCEVFSVRA